MRHDITDLLFRPGRFFERKATEKPEFLVPVLIVGAGWVISLMPPFAMKAFLPGQNVHNVIAIPAVSSVYWLLFNPFTAWILISLGLFLLSRAFSGTGTFIPTLCNAGYGMLPITLVAVLGLVISPLSDPSIALSIPSYIGLSVIFATVVMSLLLILWSGYLWMYAVEKTHTISHGKAMAAAVFVTFFYIVWSYAWTLMILMALMARR
jgi:hypothetical protein